MVANFNAQARKLYHLGARQIARTSIARVNQEQPASLFEEIFHKLQWFGWHLHCSKEPWNQAFFVRLCGTALRNYLTLTF